jgi:hypothetical protein
LHSLPQLRGELPQTTKDFMFNNKTNFEPVLSYQFRTSSNWRNAQGKRFKHDPRNAEAAKRLLELKSQIVVSDENWTRIALLVEDDAGCLTSIAIHPCG